MKLPTLEWIDANPPTVEEVEMAVKRVSTGDDPGPRRTIPCQTDDDDIVLARLVADWKRLRAQADPVTLRERVKALAQEWEQEAASRIAGAKVHGRIGARRLAADLRLGAEFELAHAERLRAALAEPAPAPSPSTEERFALVYDQGGEEIGLYTKGHIDPGPFREGATMWLKASAAAFDLDPSGGLLDALLEEDVRWEWWVDEAGDGGDLAVVFRPGAKGDPGAYPVTCLAFEGGVLAAPRAPVDAKTGRTT